MRSLEGRLSDAASQPGDAGGLDNDDALRAMRANLAARGIASSSSPSMPRSFVISWTVVVPSLFLTITRRVVVHALAPLPPLMCHALRIMSSKYASSSIDADTLP